MKLLLLLTLSISSAFAYTENVADIVALGKPSHAVLPGDLKHAACQPVIDSKLTKKEIYLHLRAKGHNLSSYLNDARFTRTHFEDIYKAVLLMPEWLKLGSSNSNNNISYKVDTYRDAVASTKGTSIFINPGRWHKFDQDMRVGILFHELSHLLGHLVYGVDDSSSWMNVDGKWRAKQGGLRRDGTIYEGSHLNPRSVISDYALTNPAEDFAESMSAYRIKPNSLKKISLKRYNFIKDTIFFGLEFIDESSCDKEVEDLLNFEEIRTYYLGKFRNPNYFKKAYAYTLRKKKNNPRLKRIEELFMQMSFRAVINSVKEDYARKHYLRIYLKHIKNFEEFKTGQARALIAKLKR